MSNHSIVHIEIPAIDPAKAGTFYTDLFGWNVQVNPAFDYHMFQAEPGPAGGFVKVSEECLSCKPGEVLIHISTDDIDATLAKAESLGGKILTPKTEIPQIGWFAFFSDPTGNRIGLFTGICQQPA
jgi:predicted enzyme related to lactoylglutathione lyase